MRVGVVHVAADPHEDQQRDAEERQQVGEVVEVRPLVRQVHVGRRRHDDHQVRGDAVRALGAADVPVREVADLHQHRHADLIDGETQVLIAEVDVADLDRGKLLRRRSRSVGWTMSILRPEAPGRETVAARRVDRDVDALPVGRTVVGGHRRPLVLVLEPAHAELEVALALVAAAVVDDDRLHGRAARRDRCRRPGRCSTDRLSPSLVSSGRLLGLRPWPSR